jgi:hypothetical protein
MPPLKKLVGKRTSLFIATYNIANCTNPNTLSPPTTSFAISLSDVSIELLFAPKTASPSEESSSEILESVRTSRSPMKKSVEIKSLSNSATKTYAGGENEWMNLLILSMSAVYLILTVCSNSPAQNCREVHPPEGLHTSHPLSEPYTTLQTKLV